MVKDGYYLIDIFYDIGLKVYCVVVYDLRMGKFLFILEIEYYVYLLVIILEICILILGLFDGIMEFYDIERGICLYRFK